MTGILERIEAKLDQLLAGGGASSADTADSGLVGGTTTAGTASTGGKKVTSEMLTELVQPLVQEEGTKAKVKAVLTKHGLNRLGEASEGQYADLYAEFKAIADGAAASGGDDLI